jgi:hypothetical protein
MSDEKGKNSVLVCYYSQMGQTIAAAKALVQPLIDDGSAQVTTSEIKPVEPFALPWTPPAFFKALELCGKLAPVDVEPMGPEKDGEYDLVVLASPIWHLSPSLPMNGFLQSPNAGVVSGRPVVILLTCRTHNINVPEMVEKMVIEAGGVPAARIAVGDPRPDPASGKALQRFMFEGKQDPPADKPKEVRAGIPEDMLSATSRFAPALTAIMDGAESEALDGLLDGAVPGTPQLEISYQIYARRQFERFSRWLTGTGGLRRNLLFICFMVWIMSCEMIAMPLLRKVYKKQLKGFPAYDY